MKAEKTSRKSMPLVSVIMPVYNAGVFLRPAIESVLDQSCKNFELLAVDDGSKDNSLDILREFQQRDKRVKVFSYKRNHGLSFAANLAIKKAKGQFLARFDADDIMPEERLEKQLNFLKRHPGVVVVGGQCVLIDENDDVLGKKNFPLTDKEIREMSFFAMSLQAGSMMINRKLIPKAFKYYTSKYRYAEDHELLFKLFQFGKVANLKDVLLYYRQHEDNSTKRVNPRQIFKEIYAIRKQWFGKDIRSGLTARLINLMQYMVVMLLPDVAIPIVFAIIRGTQTMNQYFNLKINLYKIFPKFYSTVKAYLF